MKLRAVCILLVPLVVAANPVGSVNDPRTFRIDPFHGSWKCLGGRSWDENGKELAEKEQRIVIQFDRDRITVFDRENGTGDEANFRVMNPKNHMEGMIDIFEKAGTVLIRARYRIADGRFFFCVREDQTTRPTRCGPGKKHMLYEFVPYQPKRLIQSHYMPYERLEGNIGP